MNGIASLTAVLLIGSTTFAGIKTWNFDDAPLNASPAGWKTMSATTSGASTVTGDGAPKVEYLVVKNSTVPGASASNQIVRVDDTKSTDYGAGHHLWTDAVSFADGIIECHIMGEDLVKGNGGISFRVKDHKTFYAVRLQMSGSPGIALFKVKDGSIISTGAKTSSTPVLGAKKWFNLKITVSGSTIKVAVDGTEYMNFTDATNPITTAGGVGLFARGNESIICWDNLSITSESITSAVKPSMRVIQGTSHATNEVFNLHGRKIGVTKTAALPAGSILVDRSGTLSRRRVSMSR